MKLRFCGVRGSTAAPGAEFVRYGGQTSCVAVTPIGGDHPTLLLDAGTGIRSVSALLDGAPFHGTILLTHLHWDHVQGLPFFVAADRDDADVRLLLPDGGEDAAAALRRGMSPPHFPIGPEGLRGRWTFDVLAEGRSGIEGFDVLAREIPHKGGRTFGYRISDGSGAVAYLPDHRPATPGTAARAAAIELATGVDLLVHGGQFTVDEEPMATEFGHATIDAAVELAVEAGAHELMLTHHGPGRTDDAIDVIGVALSPDSRLAVRISLAVQDSEWSA